MTITRKVLINSILDDEEMDWLLKTSEVAAILRYSVHALGIWRKQGIGPPYIVLGRHTYRYPHRDLCEWMDAQPHRIARWRWPDD